jgi:plastocyanin
MRRYLILVLAASALAASGCSSSKPDVTIQMVNYTYKPSPDVVVNRGDTVALVNGTSTVHNITLLHGIHFSLDVPAGSKVTTTKLGALKPGTYFFRCRYHYLQGMVGVLTVQATGSTP